MGSTQSVAVVGGGPGGYVAAIRAAQLGARVTLIEKNTVGGTCLNVGCIPTKAMVHAAEYARVAKKAAECGIDLEVRSIDIKRVVQYKDKVVERLVKGVGGLLKKNGVQVIKGEGRLAGPGKIRVLGDDGKEQSITADKVILSLGSKTAIPPIEGLAVGGPIITSTEALSLEAVPKTMMILGGGVIGVELACVYQALGCKVTVIEALPSLISTMDHALGEQLKKELAAQGIEVLLGCKATRVQAGKGKVSVTVDEGGAEKKLSAEKLLVAVGRTPATDPKELEKSGIRCERNRILVNEYLETSLPGVYAIGDCNGLMQLAHAASAQGECAAENAMGKRETYRGEICPACVYTFPEIASVGLSEEEAKKRGIAYHVGAFPLMANGRTLTMGEDKGFVKLIVGDEWEEILGVHMIGPNVTEIIGEAALAMQMEATADELIQTIHAHPTVSEALREAALAAEKRAIHI